MRFHLMLCAAVIIAPSRLLQQTAGTEACHLDVSGHASGPSADICQRIGDRWTDLVGTRAVPGSIRLVDRDGYHGVQTDTYWTLESPLPQRKRNDASYRKQDGILRYFAEAIIPHEAGHHVFGVYIGSRRWGASTNQYSTQFPDWLDEGVAVWMESAKIRDGRMKAIRNTTPSLDRLATLEHPNAELVNSSTADFRMSTRTVMPPCAKCTFLPDSLRRKYQIIDSGTDRQGKPKTVISYTDRAPTKSETLEEREFYALAYSLLRFIHAHGGPAAVRELISRYQLNPTPRVAVLSGLPGLPASTAAFEKAWHAFLAALPREVD